MELQKKVIANDTLHRYSVQLAIIGQFKHEIFFNGISLKTS